MRLLDGEEEPETIRYMAYSQAIEEVFGKLGFRRRKRVGWCFENMIKTLFPSGNFTGVRAIGDFNLSDNDSTSESSKSSVNMLVD